MLTPHGALILVVDGGKMKLLRNTGSEASPSLHLLQERHLRNPRAHVMGNDAPGRSFQSGGERRSAHEGRNRHQSREDGFGKQALEEALDAAGASTPLVVIAPPHMLGCLRTDLRNDDKLNVTAEIAKDLGHSSPSELADFLHRWRG
jgi:protein required for attachment to host cells